jgi:SAM-dependent methyltransferase
VTERSKDDLLARVADYYETCLARHGPTPQGVDWNGSESHELRHRQFLRLIEDPAASVVDLGCGFGDFLRFLRAARHRGEFIGYDIAPAMIDEARRLHGEGADRRWIVGAVPEPACADYAVASGVLNVRGDVAPDAWAAYVREVVETLSRTARRGFAFNVLTLSSDPERRRPYLYYADPVEMLDWCLSRFGRRIALLQDYGLYEFTMVVLQK